MGALSLPVLKAVVAETTKTHCPYCAFQCGMSVTALSVAEEAPALEVRPDDDFPVNRGQMCIKGFTSAVLLDHPDRVKSPLPASGGSSVSGSG